MECSNVHLISYLSEEEINDILIEKQSQLKHAVYIYHDMDDNEPHFHIVLKLLRSRDIDVIRRWFIIDERNTLARKNTYSNASVIEYFKHTNKASQEDGKHEYSLGDIKFFNCNIDSFLTRADNSFTILEEYLNGVPLYDIAKSHGKDFIYHIHHYKTLVELIDRERQNEFNIELSLSADLTPIVNLSDLPFDPIQKNS